MAKEVEIEISPNGEINIDMKSFKGVSCETELNKLIAQLGATLVSKKRKQEYYQSDKVKLKE